MQSLLLILSIGSVLSSTDQTMLANFAKIVPSSLQAAQDIQSAIAGFKPLEEAGYDEITAVLKKFGTDVRPAIVTLTHDIENNKDAAKKAFVKSVETHAIVWDEETRHEKVEFFMENVCNALDGLADGVELLNGKLNIVVLRIREHHNKDPAKLEPVRKKIAQLEQELRANLVAMRNLARALRGVAKLKMPEQIRKIFETADEFKHFSAVGHTGWLMGAVSIFVASAVGVFFLK
jgi:cytochrome oxidase Cu insertion factor (SCO1/SenC/PrrC family)